MAVVHISEAEAARDLPALISRVRSGESIHIDSKLGTFAIVPADHESRKPRKISEIIAALELSGSTATLDPGFAADVEDGIRSHEHERLIDPWESF